MTQWTVHRLAQTVAIVAFDTQLGSLHIIVSGLENERNLIERSCCSKLVNHREIELDVVISLIAHCTATLIEHHLAITLNIHKMGMRTGDNCRGGWPISVISDKAVSLDVTRNYYNSLFVFEDCDNENFRNKRADILKMILRSYARSISTEASKQSIIDDVKQSNERTLDSKTFDDYIEALQDLYIISDIEAWNPNIRSKTSIRTTPTRHFVDTSIACRALNTFPEDLMNDLESFGLFFEDLAVRDLSIYAQAHGGEVRHYRDKNGLECDAILHLEDGRWGAIEIKLGGDKLIEDGAKSLTALKNKIEQQSREPAPSFLMILTARGPLYQREDGIYVVPINSLKD